MINFFSFKQGGEKDKDVILSTIAANIPGKRQEKEAPELGTGAILNQR
jgi:hypothetical protein